MLRHRAVYRDDCVAVRLLRAAWCSRRARAVKNRTEDLRYSTRDELSTCVSERSVQNNSIQCNSVATSMTKHCIADIYRRNFPIWYIGSIIIWVDILYMYGHADIGWALHQWLDQPKEIWSNFLELRGGGILLLATRLPFNCWWETNVLSCLGAHVAIHIVPSPREGF